MTHSRCHPFVALTIVCLMLVADAPDHVFAQGANNKPVDPAGSDNAAKTENAADDELFDRDRPPEGRKNGDDKHNGFQRRRGGGGSGGGFSGGSAFGGGQPGSGAFGGGGFGGGDFSGGGGGNSRIVQSGEIMISWSKENDELRGFSTKIGDWSLLKIEKQSKIIPVVGGGVAGVRIGDAMAAYSGTTGTWDVLQLKPGSKAVPIVNGSFGGGGNDFVQVHDGDHHYTFAASKGQWTSPTDPSYQLERATFSLDGVSASQAANYLNHRFGGDNVTATGMDSNTAHQLLVRGPQNRLGEIRELIARLPHADGKHIDFKDVVPLIEGLVPLIEGQRAATDDPFGNPLAGQPDTPHGPAVHNPYGGPGVRLQSPARFGSKITTDLERRTLELAQSIQEQTRKNNTPADTKPLRAAVAKALQNRFEQQTAEVERMKSRLAQIEKVLADRTKNQDRIIDRRVEELLNPNIDWNAESNSTISTPTLGTTQGQSATTRSYYYSVTPPVDFPGKSPVLGTPIGRPGPPALPDPNAVKDGQTYERALPSAGSRDDQRPRQYNRSDPAAASTNQGVPLAGAVETLAAISLSQNLPQPNELFDLLAEQFKAAESWRRSIASHRESGQPDTAEPQFGGTSLVTMQNALRDAMFRWKQSWRTYESALRSLKLDVEETQLRREAISSEMERMVKLVERGYVPQSESQTLKNKRAIAEIAVQRAMERLSLYESVANDAPHLDPATFDTDEAISEPPPATTDKPKDEPRP